jgi:type VI secretion system secreted protein VgrG
MPTQLFANRPWFAFRIDSDEPGFDSLGVYGFSGVERVNKPYEFTVEVVSTSSNLNLTTALGQECLLTVADRSGASRLAHGVIRQMEQLHTANTHTHYLCHVVPRLWFLSQTQDHRIYQKQTVEDIIRAVIAKHRFIGGSVDYRLQERYQERTYCVQYGESDLHFINRLCEEEGIYYYHEHRQDGHCLCFADSEGGQPISGESNLRFYPGSGQPADTAVISRASLRHRINSDKSTFREWHFITPGVDLTSSDYETEWAKAPAPVAMELETYQFPHLYQERDNGDRYAKLQLARQLTFRQWLQCESDVSRHLPGCTFTLHSHPRDDANRGWWIVEVRQKGKQPGVLEHEAPDGRGLEYQATVTAIPDDTRFIPAIRHKKVRIEGLQSALVTGWGSEEVFPDEYGRVKVRFHWDRLGPDDEQSSCWVRVASDWAGEHFGSIQLPRVGQEVLVEFMEGDPDRPVITGRVYNAARMPPWNLPKEKHLSGIQSKEIRAARHNQLVFDDSQNQIQTQLSSDHGLSQLNLGYITRINHIEGRQDFRGEGFELRTDAWGVVRAGRGLLISTDARSAAEKHHKDLTEAIANLQGAASQHKNTANLAEAHHAQDNGADVSPLTRALDAQVDQVAGDGRPRGELAEPHIIISSPAGIALTTPGSTHLHTAANTAVTTGRHLSVSAGRSLLVSALDKVSLFAHKLGMRLFAAQGKLEIQAQSDDLEIIADKVLHIISARESVNIMAAKEVLLTAGGSYISIGENGIEEGTPKDWIVHAGSRIMAGPKTYNATMPVLPFAETVTQDIEMTFLDINGRALQDEPVYITHGSGSNLIESTDQTGTVSLKSIVLSGLSVIQRTRK